MEIVSETREKKKVLTFCDTATVEMATLRHVDAETLIPLHHNLLEWNDFVLFTSFQLAIFSLQLELDSIFDLLNFEDFWFLGHFWFNIEA